MLTSDLLPVAVTHADWGTSARKRCVAVATLRKDGGYVADGPLPVGTAGSLLERLGLDFAQIGPVVVGFDFPIGVPHAYAELAEIEAFRAVLGAFGRGVWKDFFEVAVEPGDISVHRPFYPGSAPSKGLRTRKDLTSRLGLSWPQLYRRCERATPGRRAACPLFWTVGGNQVGKAALRGWRELLQPAVREEGSRLALWPFDGSLAELIAGGRIVVVETYPAEFYGHIGVRLDSQKNGGKRSATARRRNAQTLLSWADVHRVSMTARLRRAVEEGFGPTPDGEDAFDAFVGLLGMLNVIIGRRSPGEPLDAATRGVEGWILGQTAT